MRLFSFFPLVLVMGLTVLAQTPTTGLLTGNVKDPSGAMVPNARLTLLSPSGEERTGTTAADGSYRFPLLTPGSYTLTVDAPGFQTYKATGIAIRITEATELSPSLAIAGAAASVEVTSEVPLVQTTSATTGRVISEQQIRELPLPTRNFQQILTLSPGTVASLSNNTEMGRGDVNISVAGNRSTSNNVVVDGTQINSPGTNSTPNISVPAPDAIQEFIVQTSLYDATQGRNAGGNVAVVTKSGENTVHGAAWEFFRNRELNANDFFLNAAGRPRPVLNRNQFGGTLGGPIVKDKTFFFVSYQGTRERNGASLTNSLSFPNIPSGLTNDRSLAALNALNASLYAPGATVPALSPISAKLLQARLPVGSWAIPSAAGAAASPAIPVVTPMSGVSTFREDQFNINIDQSIGHNNRLSGKVFYSDTPQYQSLFSFVGSNPFQIPGYGGNIDFHNRVVSLNDSHIVTPTLINQAHFGYSRINGPSSPQEPLKNSDVGINNPLCATTPGFCGLATIQVLGLFSIGSTTLADQKSTVQSFEWTDMLTWTRGKHLVRFGGEARRYRVDFFFNFFSRGQINFNSFKDFLDGNIAFGLLGNGVHDRGMRATDGAGFIQDDYKVSDSLTLNFGLRFQRQGGISEIRGRLANFDPSVLPAYNPACTVTSPCTNGTGFAILKPGEPLNPSTNDFAPRLGFAWKQPAVKSMVVRGGYGVYFDRFSTRVANLQIFNYPFDIVGLGLGSFANPFPNLANVTFPINPPAVPSPVPFYYAGVPLATTPTAISGIYVSQLPDALRAAVQPGRAMGSLPRLDGRNRLRRRQGHQTGQRLHPESGHFASDRSLRRGGVFDQQGPERLPACHHRRRFDLQLAAGEPHQALFQRPAVPGLVHLLEIHRRRIGRAHQRIRRRSRQPAESRVESLGLGFRSSQPLRPQRHVQPAEILRRQLGVRCAARQRLATRRYHDLAIGRALFGGVRFRVRALQPRRPAAQPDGLAQRFGPSRSPTTSIRPPSRPPAPTPRHSATRAATFCAVPISAMSISRQ